MIPGRFVPVSRNDSFQFGTAAEVGHTRRRRLCPQQFILRPALRQMSHAHCAITYVRTLHAAMSRYIYLVCSLILINLWVSDRAWSMGRSFFWIFFSVENNVLGIFVSGWIVLDSRSCSLDSIFVSGFFCI